MRQELFEHNGIQYIFDAYNASPESSAAALRLLCKMQVKGHRIALLGDMLELGRDAEAFHFALGIQAGKSNIDQLYCIGELGRKIAEGAAFAKLSGDRIKTFATAEKNKLIKTLRQELRSGDVLLLKASRALSLEDVLSALTE
jgi:UDP-N-acetylmuramoyl-tripeptide--D-alanyl-D-alanine ligase